MSEQDDNENIEDIEPQFGAVIGASYGAAERMLGSERYQADVSVGESHANLNNATADLQIAKSVVLRGIGGAISFGLIIIVIPISIYLFRMAFRG